MIITTPGAILNTQNIGGVEVTDRILVSARINCPKGGPNFGSITNLVKQSAGSAVIRFIAGSNIEVSQRDSNIPITEDAHITLFATAHVTTAGTCTLSQYGYSTNSDSVVAIGDAQFWIARILGIV